MSKPKILIVEDDKELNALVYGRMIDAGYDVSQSFDGASALEQVHSSVPDLVLLDVMIPEIDGLEVCRRLRAEYPLIYIIMLTARADELDRVVGLEVGADDYVTKPFSVQELTARVRAALRRIRLTEESVKSDTADADTDHLIVIDELVIDPLRREVKKGDKTVHLTVREFDLLLFLARNPDRPFSRMQLLEKVWDIRYEGYDRTVDSHVQRLRAKVEDEPANPRYVRTVWGIGYKIQTKPDD